MIPSEPLGKRARAAKRLHRYSFGIALVVLLFALEAWSVAAEPPGYYATAEGKAGPALRDALHQIIAGHTVVPYSSSTRTDTVDALRFLDEDPSDTNNVFLLYAQKSEPKNSYGQTNGWDNEHRWPNSYGIHSIGPAYSDLYNLHAEDSNVNASRGNKYYDNTDPSDRYYHNPAHAEAPLCTSDTDSWEPPTSIRGDLARSMFYMIVRYTGDQFNEPALHVTDNAALISSINSYMGRFSTLLAWHKSDPVSADEEARHEKIYSLYQHNRNPFIDHPEWADLVFAPVADSQSVITDQNQPVPITLTGSDVEGSALGYVVVTTPIHGVLIGVGNNLIYQPSTNYFGSDSIGFTANNRDLVSAPARVAITVNSGNAPEVPVIQSISVSGDSVTVTWSAIAGKVYQVEYKSDFAALTWNVLSGDVTASADSAAKVDLTYSTARRFYRIVAVP